MKWYYAKCGNIEKRGLVDIEKLKQMALEGELSANDLVRGETGDRWVRAFSVSGLIFSNDKNPVGEKEKIPGGEDHPGKRRSSIDRFLNR